jgi:putative redox protein
MAEKIHNVRLEQIGTAAFEATASGGGSLIIDGAPDIGGEGRGMRPMEVLLAAAASCSAMDVLHILRQQRQPLEHVAIDIQGVRADATPAPYKRLELTFTIRGAVEEPKLQRAVKLAVEKYCSVVASLAPDIEVRWSARRGDTSP